MSERFKGEKDYDYREFNKLERIGEGAYGEIYKAKWKEEVVALKIPKPNRDKKYIIKELQLFENFDYHEKIIKFYGTTKDNENQINFILEYAEDGNLRDYLDKNKKLGWSDKLNIAKEIAEGLNFLHSNGIIHRDFHSKNILVHKGRAMIADFGLSEHENVEFEASSAFGMPAYIDPHCLENSKSNYVSKKSDIYSFGVILWEISSCRQPFEGFEPYYVICNIRKEGMREQPVNGTPKRYMSLYVDCWNNDPEKRPETNSVLETLQELVKDYDPTIEKIIHVNINSSIKTYKFILSNEEKLDHVRKMILNKEETNDIQFDYFVSKNNEPIHHEEEPNISLESILRPSISLDCFDIQIIDVWTKLIEMIEKGFIFKNGLVENAQKIAFKINKNKIKSKIFKENENRNVSEIFDLTDEQKEACMCELDILCSRNLITYNNSILPWLSIFLGKSKEEASNQKLKNQIITEIFFTKLKRTEIFISREDIILEEEFRKKIEMALSSCKNYHEMINELREIAKEYGWFYARHFVFGGAIIKETNTRNSADIKQIFPLNHFSKKISYIYSLSQHLGELSKIANIQDCHIFATIMNKNEGVFSLRVEYINNENSPVIVVHKITKNKLIQHEHLKIGWIIVGLPNNFDFDFTQTEYPIVLKSKKCSISSKDGNHYKVEIPKHDDSYILSACVLETVSKTVKETFVIGSHIISSSNSACIFVHDLKGKAINDDELLQRLKLFFCTIETNQECNAGQLNIKWIESKNESNVFHGTEKENVNVFPGNTNLGQADILNNEKLILVNQIFENCCNHGFLNVNSNEIIYKALNTPSSESEKIEYFLFKL
ncbi:kinase-like protein [Gigaspora margarita]|uniref:Kinase-like protein n=1 Tax=Gigaspora margarita TaxID=4874 RepID=A0A8H4B1X3_GIGMA|nr:kinase-like protein [Gigaspora margarita]